MGLRCLHVVHLRTRHPFLHRLFQTQVIRRFLLWQWRASEGFRWKLAADVLCGLLLIALSLMFVYVSKEAIDYVTQGGELRSSVWWFAVALVGIYALELCLDLITEWIENQTEISLKNKLRHRLYNHLMQVTWEGWEQLHSGDVQNRLEEDIRIVTETFCKSGPQLVTTCVQIVAAADAERTCL